MLNHNIISMDDSRKYNTIDVFASIFATPKSVTTRKEQNYRF
jgi:hypothetical protein